MTMRFMQLLLEALALPPNGRRKPSRVVIALVTVAVFLLLGGLALTIWTLAEAGAYSKRSGDSSWLSGVQMLIVPCYYLVALPPAALLAWNRRQMRLFRPVREALSTGAAGFAPSLPVAPLPFTGQETRSSRRIVLYPLQARPILRPLLIATLVGALPLWLLIIVSGLPWTIGANENAVPDMSTITLLACVMPLLLIITQSIVVVVVLKRRVFITTNEDGLSWRLGRSRRTRDIPWSDVRAFYIAPHQQMTFLGRQECLAHIVMTGDDGFGWMTPAWHEPRVQYDSWRLAKEIEAHTGQSPRDLAALRAIAEGELRRESQLTVMGIPTTLFHALERAYRYMTRRFWLAIALAVVFELPLLVFSFRLFTDSRPLPPVPVNASPQTMQSSEWQASLFLVNGATAGAYTNFAVYPVKPPSSSRYV